MKLENIIKLRLNNFEINPPKDKMDITPNPCWEGYEPIGLKEDGSPNCVPIKAEKMQAKQVDLADYPWEQCIADQTERYGDEETAKKVCGAIKAMYGSKQEMEVVKEGFPVPSPSADEDENAFIGRCMKEIGGEYEQAQALAICYSKWKGE